MLNRLKMQIQMLFHRANSSTYLDNELKFHLDQQIAENRAAGMSPEEARKAALRTFGNPGLLREQSRATWHWSSLELLWHDLRLGLRSLRRSPGFTAIAIVVMALGLGANIALFTVVRGVLLRPLPYHDPSQLLVITEGGDEVSPDHPVAAGVYREWIRQNRSFSQLALVGDSELNLSATGTHGEAQPPETLRGAFVTANLLPTLGVDPALGRGFNEADDRRAAPATALLSWSLWNRRFGADSHILGRTIEIDKLPYTVIGVMPAWFAFPDSTTQIWTPLFHTKPDTILESLDLHQFRAIGRLQPGISESQGRADLSMIVNRIRHEHQNDPYISLHANSRPILENTVGDIRTPLYLMLAASGCVLLIACLNVANLLVARASARRKEFAIRAALGGSRLRLLRERILESLLISSAGGLLGLALAALALRWLVHVRGEMSRVESIHIDLTVLAFTVGLSAFCALFAAAISALNPALDSGEGKILIALRQSSRSHTSGHGQLALRRLLLTLEVALTVVLLIASGLLIESYQRLRSSAMGCLTENVLTLGLSIPVRADQEANLGVNTSTPSTANSTANSGPVNPAQTKPGDPKLVNFYLQMLAQVRALPGVKAAGFTEAVPGQGYLDDVGFTIPEHPALPLGHGLFAMDRWVDPGYFNTMGIPLLKGRLMDPSQRLDRANEAVISQLFAQRYFPGENPIGRHIQTISGRLFTIVGIVGDTRYSLSTPPEPAQYFPLYAGIENTGSLVVRSTSNVETLAMPIQRIIQSLDPDLPVSGVLTMDELLGKSTADRSFNATLLVGFSVLSLILAIVGLAGVLSYIVAQRTSEIGIRMALGAQREAVLRLILLDGLRPAVFGLGLGLVASLGATRLIESMLYGTRPLDPAVFATVSLLMLLAAAGACLAPAWRASRLDPMQALRSE